MRKKIISIVFLITMIFNLSYVKAWADTNFCEFNKNVGGVSSEHLLVFLIDGSIHSTVEPSRKGAEYWKNVVRSDGPLQQWMIDNTLPLKSLAFTFGMAGNVKGQSWGDFLVPVSKELVGTENLLPLDGTDAHRRAFGVGFIAPYMAIKKLGECGFPPLLRSLHLIVASDNQNNTTGKLNLPELTVIENTLLNVTKKGGSLKKDERGNANKWVTKVSENYSFDTIDMALFPHKNPSEYMVGEEVHDFSENNSFPLRTSLLEVKPHEVLEIEDYFTVPSNTGFQINENGFTAQISFKPSGITGSFTPLSLCAYLVLPKGDKEETRKLQCFEGDEIKKEFKVDVQIRENDPRTGLKIKLGGDFHYSLHDTKTLNLDLGLIQDDSFDTGMTVIPPLALPDGTLINSKTMKAHPGMSQKEIIEVHKNQEAQDLMVKWVLAIIAACYLVWLYFSRKNKARDSFPKAILTSAIKVLASSKYDASLFSHSKNAVIIGSETYDLRHVDQIPEIVLGSFVLKNEAKPNGKGIKEELKVDMEIEVTANTVDEMGTLISSPELCREGGVVKLNNEEKSSVRFSGAGQWLISLNLGNLKNMEQARFPHHDLMVLTGSIAYCLKGKENERQSQQFCLPVTVVKMPFQCEIKIELKNKEADDDRDA